MMTKPLLHVKVSMGNHASHNESHIKYVSIELYAHLLGMPCHNDSHIQYMSPLIFCAHPLGPKPATVLDMWCMIWQLGTNPFVMLTRNLKMEKYVLIK